MRDLVILVSLDDIACRALARQLRAEHVYCRIVPASTPVEEILQQEARGILLAGGATGEAADVPFMMDYLQCGLPMLCLGDAALTLTTTLGGSLGDAAPASSVMEVRFDHDDALFAGVEDGERYLPSCRYLSLTPLQGAPSAQTEDGVLGFRASQRNVWGLAFPLERHDLAGTQILINFCRDVCACTLWWSNQTFVDTARDAIDKAADGGEALCAISGGVDSGVCALLGNMALGHRLHCIFVDTGLLRKDEADQVLDFYHTQVGLNLRRIDAADEFLAALAGVRDPAEKERIIFGLLRDILNREAASIPGIRLLIQGTNYADALEGSDFPMELPAEDVQIIEPVRELFKDEVRHVGEDLGLPATMTHRQPFPGSGLAIRIMTDVTPERLAILREADALFRGEIAAANQGKRLWQYFASLAESPIPGGGYIVILRAVQAVDDGAGMPARLPSDLLERVTAAIMDACPQVDRVLYDFTPSRSYAQAAGK